MCQWTAGGRSGRSLVARSVPRRAERATRSSPKPATVPTRLPQVLAPDRVQATATGPVLPTATPRSVPVNTTTTILIHGRLCTTCTTAVHSVSTNWSQNVRIGTTAATPVSVHGGWSQWAESGRTECSKTCGTGSQTISETRTCINPPPSGIGAVITGRWVGKSCDRNR